MTEKEFKIKVLANTELAYPMALRMLRSDEAARDALQLSLLKLWEKRKRLLECENVKSFVFKVVRNTCLDELKRKKNMLFEAEQEFSSRNDFQKDYEAQEAAQLIFKLVEELPGGQKEVLQMRDIDGLEFDEIAEIMEYDLPYIRVLLSRARKNIKQKLLKLYAYEATRKKRVNW